jgi:hypothetical protein
MRKKRHAKRDTKTEMREWLRLVAMAANDGFWPPADNEGLVFEIGLEALGRLVDAIETKFRPNLGERILPRELRYFDTIDMLADYLHDTCEYRAHVNYLRDE